VGCLIYSRDSPATEMRSSLLNLTRDNIHTYTEISIWKYIHMVHLYSSWLASPLSIHTTLLDIPSCALQWVGPGSYELRANWLSVVGTWLQCLVVDVQVTLSHGKAMKWENQN
jgi:hypothetical protein